MIINDKDLCGVPVVLSVLSVTLSFWVIVRQDSISKQVLAIEQVQSRQDMTVRSISFVDNSGFCACSISASDGGASILMKSNDQGSIGITVRPLTEVLLPGSRINLSDALNQSVQLSVSSESLNGRPFMRTAEVSASSRKYTADRKSTRLNSSHLKLSRMPSSA